MWMIFKGRTPGLSTGLMLGALALGACQTNGSPAPVSTTPIATSAGALIGAVAQQTASQKFVADVVAACGFEPEVAVVNGIVGAVAGSIPYATVAASELTAAEQSVCTAMTAQAATAGLSAMFNGHAEPSAPTRKIGVRIKGPRIIVKGRTITITGKWVR